MVQRQCPKCNALFDRKSHYDYHINRKTDCNRNKNNIIDENGNSIEIQNIPKYSILNPEYSKMDFTIPNNNPNNKINDDEDELSEIREVGEIDDYIVCGFCLKSYSSKSNLNKHLKVCKVKKTNDLEKENIFKLLLEKDKHKEKQIEELKKYNEEIIKHNKDEVNELKKQNKLLMDKINKLMKTNSNSSTSTTNSNNSIANSNSNSNNTINSNNVVMVNFGKEDLSVIDERQFIDRIVKNNISGVKIPDEVLKIIHFNPKYPQLSNIYISDINREKCMVYEDGEWKLSNVNNIPQIMDKVCVYSSEQISNLRTKHPNNKPLEDRLNTIEKYNNMIDGDYVDDLRDDGRQLEIARCEEFQAHTYNTLKKTLYNEGKKLKKNIKLK
jgi:hypothetical protein